MVATKTLFLKKNPIMKYPTLSAALGWTESNDNDGAIYLQKEEAERLEQKLAAAATGIKTPAPVVPFTTSTKSTAGNKSAMDLSFQKELLEIADGHGGNSDSAVGNNKKYETSFDRRFK
jgi:hypothetical protein